MLTITIDGPAGAGKSTTAKIVAKALGIQHLNTGAMYRALAVKLVENNVAVDDVVGIDRFVSRMKMQVKFLDDIQHVIVNGDDVTDKLYSNEISNLSSKYSTHFCVRQALTNITRQLSAKLEFVIDGRDSGSYVLPYAKHKFYLDCDAKVRAQRRFDELKQKNELVDFDKIYADIVARDEFDKNKKIAPLVVPQGAVVIDNSNLNEKETADKILFYIH